MSKMKPGYLVSLKTRIIGVMECTDLNGESLGFCEKILARLDQYGVDALISEKELNFLSTIFLKHNIPHPDAPPRY
jgi:hypothetical protein